VEAQEAAFLRRGGRALCRRLQPLAKLRGLFWRRFLDQQRVDGTQLIDDVLARLRALGLEARHRILVLPGLLGDVGRERLNELTMAAALRCLEHGLDRRTRLLDGLDRATGIGERDRHARDQRRTRKRAQSSSVKSAFAVMTPSYLPGPA
jgi:hypothetical protein